MRQLIRVFPGTVIHNHSKLRRIAYIHSLFSLVCGIETHVVDNFTVGRGCWNLSHCVANIAQINLLVDYFCCDHLSKLEVRLFLRSFRYGLYSFSTAVNDGQLQSLTRYQRSVNWYEREMWDMYGLYVQNHPDLSRILTDYGFLGFPLRKDFPLVGYKELRYNEETKGLDYSLIYLVQDYRFFDMSNYWEL